MNIYPGNGFTSLVAPRNRLDTSTRPYPRGAAWPTHAVWMSAYDQRTVIRIGTLADCLEYVGFQRAMQPWKDHLFDLTHRNYWVDPIRE